MVSIPITIRRPTVELKKSIAKGFSDGVLLCKLIERIESHRLFGGLHGVNKFPQVGL